MDEHIKREAAIRVICDCCAVCADIECCDYAKGSYGGCKEIEGLRAIPAADVVEVVRCKDCKYSYDGVSSWCCSYGVFAGCIMPGDFYCKCGERKEGEA